jgi:integrase
VRTAPLRYRFESYEAKSGKRWRCVVRLSNGKRETTSWRALQREAKADGDGLLERLAGPKPSDLTVSRLLARYIDVRTLRPTTRQRYQHDADVVAENDIGGRIAEEVLPAEWDEYFASLDLAPKSVGNRRGLIRAAYRWAVKGRLLTYNPVADTDPPKVIHEKPPAPTMDRVQGAVAVIDGNRLEGAGVLCAAGGLRIGEAVARKWSDIDDTGVNVQTQYTQTRDAANPNGKRIVLHLGPPKSDRGKRHVPLPSPALAHLAALKRRQQIQSLSSGRQWSDDRLISSRGDGSPVPPNQASSELGRLWRRAGFSEMHPHLLRHAFITELIVRQGVDPQTASEMAGHSEAATTVRHYTHTDDAAKTAAAGKLSQAWEEGYERLVDSRQHQMHTKSGGVADIAAARGRKRPA